MFLQHKISNLPPKTSHQIKRQSLHLSLANSQKQRIKKSLRFQNLSQLVLKQYSIAENKFQDIPADKVELIARQYMMKRDLVGLLHCMAKVQEQFKFESVLSMEFLKQFVQFSQDLINQPQIILIYKILSATNPQLYCAVFKRKRVIENIVREIQTLKPSFAQEIYMEVLQYLVIPRHLKRQQEQICHLFDTFSQMIENKTVEFDKGLKILKGMSHFINQERNFSLSIVNRIIDIYEEQIKNEDPIMNIMVDCFIILVKIIYYQTNIDVITNVRLIKTLLHAKQFLPSKVIEVYYNIFNLLAKLVEKTGQYQILNVTKEDLQKTQQKLINHYGFIAIDIPQKENYLISLILNNILSQNRKLLQVKQFKSTYLNFILKVVTYCATEIIFQHFMETNFFEFLVEAIDFQEIQVNGFALQIILTLLHQDLQNGRILNILKDYHNLKSVLENKILRTQNKFIETKSHLILEKFEMFDVY